MIHELLRALTSATQGSFPPVDGAVTFVDPWIVNARTRLDVVLCFTGHAIIATPYDRDEVLALGADGFGGAVDPTVLSFLGTGGTIGVHDVTLFALGTSAEAAAKLPERSDLDDHYRVRHARALRSDVRVYGDERGLVTIGTGFGGRVDLGIEVWPNDQGKGWGRSLLRDACAVVEQGTPIFAGVSPGNARSLRMFLACGWTPIGSEVQIVHATS